MTTPDQRPENGLACETSPYLLQHRHNPVDWHPWGEEAFEKARREDKPLLISIGYSACHWCHVMERETFENEKIAALINATVVPVKVDREERPDVDAVYMAACVALSGSGGWPLNAFVTPDLQPFFVGTYYPPEDRHGRPGFPHLVARIGELWRADRPGLLRQAAGFVAALQSRPSTTGDWVPPDISGRVIEAAVSQYDETWGGFGGAPKFPPETFLAELLRCWRDTGAPEASGMVAGTLEAMLAGGIRDHLAGGFARYAVDERWLIPHFEKMLYNQALLAPVFLDAHLATGEESFLRVGRETLDWAMGDLRSPQGLFYCAFDADSAGGEGLCYTWTHDEVVAVLGANDGQLACDYYGVTQAGNFEDGRSVLHEPVPLAQFAAERNVDSQDLAERLTSIRARLLEARRGRVAPALDDKCLAGWNGLMISALARGWQVTGDDHYLRAANETADALTARLLDSDGRLWRCLCKGRRSIPGLLEDYAFLALALVDLYESDFDIRRLELADRLCVAIVAEFSDPRGGFLLARQDDANVIVKSGDMHDNALPSPSASAALALLRVCQFFERPAFDAAGRRAIARAASQANAAPTAFPTLLHAARFAGAPVSVVIASLSASAPEVRAFTLAAHRSLVPALAVACTAGLGPRVSPLFDGKTPLNGRPAAYVCHDNTCVAPVGDPAMLPGVVSNI